MNNTELVGNKQTEPGKHAQYTENAPATGRMYVYTDGSHFKRCRTTM